MSTNPGLPAFILFAVLVGGCGARAQTAGLDEAIGPDGPAAPTISLTATQRGEIYKAVMQQRVHRSGGTIPAVIGAAVPPSATLRDLPGGIAFAVDGETADLKYATVADNVVVVDPIRMRVVDVIQPGTRP